MGVVDPVSDVLQALVLGAGIGAAFGVFHLPPPAPQTLAGVVGLLAIVVAWWLVGRWTQ